mgnify:FL=1
MKLLLENWRRFLKEEQEYEIYCDMDGVLVDFELGVVEYITAALAEGRAEELKEKIGRDYITTDDLAGPTKNNDIRNYMYKELENHAQFWEDLPWMSNGKELWARIWPYGPNILTTPMGGEDHPKSGYGSRIGKQAWIDKNLVKEMQMPPKKIIMAGDKYRWANKTSILIDDWTKNTGPWGDKKIGNGIAILHKNEDIQKTFDELEKHGL